MGGILSLQMSYLSMVTTEDDLKKEEEEHNAVRSEFKTTQACKEGYQEVEE